MNGVPYAMIISRLNQCDKKLICDESLSGKKHCLVLRVISHICYTLGIDF